MRLIRLFDPARVNWDRPAGAGGVELLLFPTLETLVLSNIPGS